MKKRLTKLLRNGRSAAAASLPSSSSKFLANEQGAIAILAAVMLPVAIGVIALAVEFGHGLLIRDETQRVADEAAYAGALAYAATGNQTSMLSAAQNVAVLNGVATTKVAANLLASSPRDATSPAVQATITTDEPIVFGQVVGFGGSITIKATSYTEIPSSTPPCVLALKASGAGVSLSGGTTVSAPSCVVASQASVVVPCGTHVTAEDVYYNGSARTVGCAGGIVGTVKKVSSADPLAGNAGIVAANARAVANESLAAPTMPAMPSAPAGGTSITFGYWPTSFSAAGCSALLSGSTWTVSCPAGGTYNFQAITVPGGLSVQFTTTGSGSTTYNISGAVTNSGSNLSFGSGTFNIAGGVVTNGGTTTSFGSGTFNIYGTVTNSGSSLTFGSGTFNLAGGLVTGGGTTTTFGAGTFNIGQVSCSAASSATYSICHTGSSLTFGGPSTFVLTSGVYNSGGETITFGSGSTNSYQIGASSNGYGLNVGGESITTLADATGSNSVFQMVGDLYQSGGSCITLPAATNHDIDGSVSVAGGLTLGSGLYAIAGNFWAGASNGGDVTCNSVAVGVSGTNVAIALTGSSPKAVTAPSTNVFVIGSGFNHVTLLAPGSGTYQNVAIVGPLSTSVTGGFSLTEGASATTVDGALYFPNGPMTLSGGASIGSGAGQCLEIVATQITLSGGTAVASQCLAGAGASGTPFLVE